MQFNRQGAGRPRADRSTKKIVRSLDPVRRKKALLGRGDLPVDLEISYQEETYRHGYDLSFELE